MGKQENVKKKREEKAYEKLKRFKGRRYGGKKLPKKSQKGIDGTEQERKEIRCRREKEVGKDRPEWRVKETRTKKGGRKN